MYWLQLRVKLLQILQQNVLWKKNTCRRLFFSFVIGATNFAYTTLVGGHFFNRYTEYPLLWSSDFCSDNNQTKDNQMELNSNRRKTKLITKSFNSRPRRTVISTAVFHLIIYLKTSLKWANFVDLPREIFQQFSWARMFYTSCEIEVITREENLSLSLSSMIIFKLDYVWKRNIKVLRKFSRFQMIKCLSQPWWLFSFHKN